MHLELAKTPSLELTYEGSVKRVWHSSQNEDRLWFEFTDDYSIFDWGKMPDTVANKGRSLAVLGGFFFDRLTEPSFWQSLPASKALERFDRKWLEDRFTHPIFAGRSGLAATGATTHYQSLTQSDQRVQDLNKAVASPHPIYMEVLRAAVHRPQPHIITGSTIYFYPHSDLEGQAAQADKRRLVPLEIVFRFGMPSGSSLPARLAKDPSYFKTLGLTKAPQVGEFFDRPVIELYTKLEPKDRLLSIQEAASISGLTPQEFENMIEFAFAIALALFHIFASRSIELWDGKVEMLVDAAGGLLLADSIGPDELRLIASGCHLSKEMIRQLYRGSSWELAIKQAQELAKQRPGSDWKEICKNDLHAQPQPLPRPLKALVDQLYGVITNHILDSEIFTGHPSLDQFVQSVPADLIAESELGSKVG